MPLDSTDRRALQAILRADPRPWPSPRDRLSEPDRALVEIIIRGADMKAVHLEADDLVSSLEALGFRPTKHGGEILFEDSLGAGAMLAVKVVVSAGASLVALHQFIEAITVLPDNLRKLYASLAPDPRAQLHEVLHLEVIAEWLDNRYGPRNWGYDPDSMEMKPIANVVVAAFTETNSGTSHLLAIHEGRVEELPLSWLSAPAAEGASGLA